MSIPPDNVPPDNVPPGAPPPGSVPPGGYYAAPPPQSNSGGCWKAAGITCAVLVVLAAVAVFFAVRAFKDEVTHHRGVFGAAYSFGTTVANGEKIQKAVVLYHTQHRKYPDSLMDLVADGLIDGKILHSSFDTDPNPGHVSWVYTKPAESAPGDTPILKLHYRLNLPIGNASQQSQESDVIINLDGTTVSNTEHSTVVHPRFPHP